MQCMWPTKGMSCSIPVDKLGHYNCGGLIHINGQAWSVF